MTDAPPAIHATDPEARPGLGASQPAGKNPWWTSPRARAAGGALLLLAVSPYLMSMTSWRRPSLGVVSGRLLTCPAKPNCVCSHQWFPIVLSAEPEEPAQDARAPFEHGMPPWGFEGPPEIAWARLQRMLARQPGCRVLTATPTYLRVEVSSRWLRFVDDVEFLLPPGQQVIHFRSASRVGYSDLGVNRQRMDAWRALFEKEPPP